MAMSDFPIPPDEKLLRDALENDPADWVARKQLAHLLYDQELFQEAADVIWAADEIPNIDVELAFAARVLAKAAPRKTIRLLSALLEHNHGKAVQNLGMANALLHYGMVLEAARFYGAALEADPSLGNPDLEHFILWTDDEETLWGDFQNRKPKLGELPWMKRDPQEAMRLTATVKSHTTPISLPGLEPAAGEELVNELYQQKAEKGAEPSPPPAVTIPLDRVDPKYRRFDPELGAPTGPEAPAKQVPSEETKPEPAAVTLPKPSIKLPSLPASSPVPGAPSAGSAGPRTKTLQFATPPPTLNRPRPPLPPLKKPGTSK
jgi:tetratricopeptide (TPR) repeat protein